LLIGLAPAQRKGIFNMHDYQHSLPDLYRLPRAPVPVMTPANFVACPFALMNGLSASERASQLFIYQMALEQAQVNSTPSLLERDLLAVWN
jgi:hypothetical protein